MTTTHPATIGNSQCNRILAALENNFGEWVSMPVLSKASKSLNVHSRVSDLRNRGHRIEHYNMTGKNHAIKSFYRLVG